MGEAWLPSARHAAARSAPRQVARDLLRDVVPLPRSGIRALLQPWPALLLPQLRALSRIYASHRPRRAAHCHRTHGGSRFAPHGRVRPAVRAQAILAVGAAPLRAPVEDRERSARAARSAMIGPSTLRVRCA